MFTQDMFPPSFFFFLNTHSPASQVWVRQQLTWWTTACMVMVVMPPGHGWAWWMGDKGRPVWSCWTIALFAINHPAVMRQYSLWQGCCSSQHHYSRSLWLRQCRAERTEMGCPQLTGKTKKVKYIIQILPSKRNYTPVAFLRMAPSLNLH